MEAMISSISHQQQAETAMKVQMSVMKKSMDVQRDLGEMIVGLIEGAAPQALQSPAKTPGLGENFDMYA